MLCPTTYPVPNLAITKGLISVIKQGLALAVTLGVTLGVTSDVTPASANICCRHKLSVLPIRRHPFARQFFRVLGLPRPFAQTFHPLSFKQKSNDER